jgi:pSer/pThr/pTyr-binding forkhead associated (FHA) protein
MVDYIVQGSTVGKLHAEITLNKGVYWIRDLNSKNGTYLNDIRIPNNKECEIKSNDRIRFSNYEYLFMHQKVL